MKTESKNGFTLLETLLVILTLAVLGALGYIVSTHLNKTSTISVTNQAPANTPKPVNNGVQPFTATVTADECATSKIAIGDVGCEITVNQNIEIYVRGGNMVQTQPWGNFEGTSIVTDITGHKVSIYAKKITPTRYTLEGSANYYVKLIN